MFKSVFVKYVTAVMSIFALGFILLLVVVTSIVNNYIVSTKEGEVKTAASALRDCVYHASMGVAAEDFSEKMNQKLGDKREPIATVFAALAENDSDLTLVLADRQGNLLYVVSSDGRTDASREAGVLPEAVLEAVREAGYYEGKLAVFASEQKLPTRIEGIFDRSGELCGVVAVSISRLSWGNMMQEMTETILSTALLVLLAAMIAIYFISNRVISPLREMSVAAKDFSKGNFHTRIRVRGSDEVAQLAAALNNMAESLENLEHLRSSFIANVSHDLRTPMTTIAGFIEEIRDGVIPPEKQDDYLGIIEAEVKRLSRLVASLLDLSRIQAGDRKFTMRPFDICEMGRQILISFEAQIEEKHLQVAFESDSDRVSVLADSDAIYQTFYNLCHNAVKFSREGGALRIRITETKEKKVRVAVYNEGEGIPKEDLPYIFERFYKSDKSRGLDKSGLGLGLYIAKAIVDAHGESVWAESEPGKYCEFFFTLRKAQSEPERTGKDENR